MTSYDLIVVGAGTAGLPAAIAAADAGARVLLLEKTGRIGGTLYWSTAQMSAGGTRRQRERGIEDSPQEHYDDILRIGHGTQHNLPVLRRFTDLAPAAMDWLDDNGFDWVEHCPAITYGHEPYRKARTVWSARGGMGLLAFLTRMIQPHLDSGQVDLRLNAAADSLVTEAGRVVGVRSDNADFRAPAVILTTGGYGSNDALFSQYTGGRRNVTLTAPSSTGDAIALTAPLGATVVGTDHYLPTLAGVEDPAAPGRAYNTKPDTWDAMPMLVPQGRAPWEIWVDARGRRFVQEDVESIDARERAVADLPDMRFFLVFDEAILAAAPPIFRIWDATDIRRLAAEGGFIQSADSIAALAARIDVPADALAETVRAYNDAMAGADPMGRQHRPLPVVQPPYYAIRLQGMNLAAWGGLRVDDDLRVLRADGSPIDGLYAAGETIGAGTFVGDAFCGGTLVGPCVTFGRYLGTTLARHSVVVAS